MSTSGTLTSVTGTKAKSSHAIADLFKDFLSEYDQADELCKKVQLFREAAGIPAINEMRYAGYHLRRSFDDNGNLVDEEQLRRARGHAQRATYEAAEAGLLLALREINLFKEDYRKVVVTGDVKDYVQILRACEDAKKRLGVKREINDGQVLDHTKHKELFEKLSEAADLLHAARPEINKRMSDTRTLTRRWIITTFVALALGALAFFKDKLLALL